MPYAFCTDSSVMRPPGGGSAPGCACVNKKGVKSNLNTERSRVSLSKPWEGIRDSYKISINYSDLIHT